MRKGKNIFNYFTLSLAGIISLSSGVFLLTNKEENYSPSSLSQTNAQEIDQNIIPEYFEVSSTGAYHDTDNTTFLLTGNGSISFKMAQDEKTVDTDKVIYFDEIVPDSSYYYYTFSNITLHYNDDLTTNLLEERGNYITSSTALENNVGPEKLDITFTLNDISDGSKFNLPQTGLYTFSASYHEYFTDNAGDRVVSQQQKIEYKFFVFNKIDYINDSNKPNYTFNNTQTVNINSSEFSTYMYYNYSTLGNTLPSINYNTDKFALNIEYTDQDKKTSTLQADQSGLQVFTDIGNYDITTDFIYKVGDITYNLPIDNKMEKPTPESASLQTQAQRVYIYGYQTKYTNYSEKDELTNQPKAADMKEFTPNDDTFFNSSDITSKFIEKYPSYNQVNSSAHNVENLKTDAIALIKGTIPASTNQAPVQFKANATLDTDHSMYYKLTKNDGGSFSVDTETDFTGLNQNEPGTYLYILQYSFDNYMNASGNIDKTSSSYQIFFFEITNITESVKITTEADGKVLYTNGFTNQNVIIENTSEQTAYNADVEITVTAQDYLTGKYLCLNDVLTDGIILNASSIEYKDGKVIIPKTFNARYTVSISSKLTTNPSTTVFTIDSYNIDGIEFRTAYKSTASSYTINSIIPEQTLRKTNEPFLISWNEKKSGAKTYAYVKAFTMEDYTSTFTASNSVNNDATPVDKKIDMTAGSSWDFYNNSFGFDNTISSTYVKTVPGLYVIEIYDQAGNTAYDVCLLDTTSQKFIQIVSGNSTSYSYINSNTTISIDENSVKDERSILYTQYKAIPVTKATNLISYTGENVTELINDKVETSYIATSQFLKIETSSNFYYQRPDSNNYYRSTMNFEDGFKIDLVSYDAQGNMKAIEGTWKFFIRDASNTKTMNGNEQQEYLSRPSNYLTFNVSSDQSKTTIYYGADKTLFDYASYNMTGNLYYKESDQSYNIHGEGVSTDLKYKYTYASPINTKDELFVSFVAKPLNTELSLQTVTLKYYAYKLTSDGDKHFYTFSSTPTISQTLCTESDIQNISQGQTTEISLALGATTEAVAGKYVIERIYNRDNAGDVDSLDFFLRRITFTIDKYGVISPIESVDSTIEGENYTYLESVIGSDILLQMYSGEETTADTITYPDYTVTNGKIEGGSFYTNTSFNETDSVKTTIKGNKLPMYLYIPVYKYTECNTYNASNTYDVTNNNQLSYYGNLEIREIGEGADKKFYVYSEGKVVTDGFLTRSRAMLELVNYAKENNMSIVPYELEAVIEYRSNSGAITYYRSKNNGISNYLEWHKASSPNADISASTTPVEYFYLPGTYTVTLYQARNDQAIGKIYSCYKFAFEITSQAPDFDVSGDGFILSSISREESQYAINEIIYTNSNNLSIFWNDPKTNYYAKINEEAISITGAESFTLDKENNQITGLKFSSARKPNEGAIITISMQFEGHNADFYKYIQKTIIFDSQAPVANVESLMTKAATSTDNIFAVNYQYEVMKNLYDYNSDLVDYKSMTADQTFSYCYPTTDGIFKNYAYPVKAEFAKELYSTIDAKNFSGVQRIYYKQLDEVEYRTHTPVEKDSFSEYNNYYLIDNKTINFAVGSYYEVVEFDAANNMTVYFIYVNDESEENVAISFYNINHKSQPISYLDTQIAEEFNIYSNTAMEIRELNFKNDSWQFVTLEEYGSISKRYYITTPAGAVYKLTLTEGGKEYQELAIADIFKDLGSNAATRGYKNKLTFADRVNSSKVSGFLTVMDVIINLDASTDQIDKSLAHLSIDYPNENATSMGVVLPTEITVFIHDGANYVENAKIFKNVQGNWDYTTSPSTEIRSITINVATGIEQSLNIDIAFDHSGKRVKYQVSDNFYNSKEFLQYVGSDESDKLIGQGVVYEKVENNGQYTYLSDKTITYTFNTDLYVIEYKQAVDDVYTKNVLGEIVFKPTANIYDTYWSINVYDSVLYDTDKINAHIKTFQVRLYNKLPEFVDSDTSFAASESAVMFKNRKREAFTKYDLSNGFADNSISYVSIAGQTYDVSNAPAIRTYSSNVTFRFTNGQAFANTKTNEYEKGYGYSIYILDVETMFWDEITSLSVYTMTNVGRYAILIKYDSQDTFTHLYQLYLVEILDATASYYYVEVKDSSGNWSVIEPVSNGIKYIYNGREYDTNYILNIPWEERSSRLRIEVNEELEVGQINGQPLYIDTSKPDANIEIYQYECSQAKGYFTIIYIEQADNISNFSYEEPSGEEQIQGDITVDINKNTESGFDRLKINFSTYYAIEQNLIVPDVSMLLNGQYVSLNANVYREGEESFIYLDKAGTYKMSLKDSCSPSNVHKINGISEFTIIYLDSIPFEISYISGDQTIVTTPIQKAVYNSPITLTLTNVSTYYSPIGTPVINVKFNGKEATNYAYSNNSYTFSEPGYYTINFEATSAGGVLLRNEIYSFTIVNPNESRYAYEFTEYKQYYIEKVVKNGKDITENLIEFSNNKTIVVNGKPYLAGISLNHLDSKTGEGRYEITINTNDATYSNVMNGGNFTFTFWINKPEVPLNISIEEGASTTDPITITFNVLNFYEEVGDSYIKIGNSVFHYTAETIAQLENEIQTLSINYKGTYYIQVYTQSGNLLYSYKVIKTEPLNAFSIIAIVIGVLALGAIIAITIRLRNRQKVK